MDEQGTISVVIPALDAAARIGAALAAVAGRPSVRERIVVDGGSTDGTAALATAAGARLIAAAPGRGTQLAAGARAATGDWLLFLHADTVLEAGWEDAAACFMAAAGPATRAAAFRFALDDPGRRARLIEAGVALRCRLFGLPYGDQGLLISRAAYDRIGGFRDFPLFEDVDIVRRIGRRNVVLLAARAVTSAARYRRDGYLRRPLRNVALLMLYFAGLPPARLAGLYGRA